MVRFRNGVPQELTCKARSEAHWTALILRRGWELFPCWEESGRSPSAGLAGLALLAWRGPGLGADAPRCPAGAARNGANRLSSGGTGSAD